MTTLAEWKDWHRVQWGLGSKRKVAIVGFCSTSRDWVPYDDPDMEIWGLNRGAIFMPRADRWFEMHGKNIYSSQQRRPGRHTDWLNKFQGPVYMHQVFEDVKNSVAFPLREVAENIGDLTWRVDKDGQQHDTRGEPYLSSSIAYEIALAIWEGFQEIVLYGIDLNTSSEYAWQKPGVEWLLGLAAGRGIKVILPDNCPLAKGTLYGRGFMSERPEHMSYEQLAERMRTLQGEVQAVNAEFTAITGAHRELKYLSDQMIPGLDQEILEERAKQMQARISTLHAKQLQAEGALKETAYWLHQTMAGQEPKEAIDQLNKILQPGTTEGPLTVHEVLTSVDPAFAAIQRETGQPASGEPVPVGG